jgi:RNA polymerase sigma factor (sigma-70 family)
VLIALYGSLYGNLSRKLIFFVNNTKKSGGGPKKLKEIPFEPRIKDMAALAERQLRDVGQLIPTRHSLLSRLKNWDDHESWRVFFNTYWRLVYNMAMRAGLTDAEAQDVVQETVISVMKSMPGFNYDASKGSFKGWLMRLTQWRIVDQFRKRQKGIKQQSPASDADEVDAIANVVDPAASKLETAWNEEWERNLLEAAVEKVKAQVDPKQYQIFDLYVIKQWPVMRVVRILKINPGKVYLAKHRIGKLLQDEITRLRTKPI